MTGVVVVGDSTSYMSNSWFYKCAGSFPLQSSVLPRAYWRGQNIADQVWANYAISGQRIGDLVAGEAARDALKSASGSGITRHYVLCVLIGTNPTANNGADQAALVRPYCLAAQAAGWNVLLGTIISRTDGILPNFDTVYAQPYNAIIRNWTTSDGVAGIIDFASDSRLGATDAANNATYFSDTVHPTDAGYTIMQGIAAPVISNLIAGL